MFSIKYVSNKRDTTTGEFEVIQFGKYPYFVSYSDLNDYEWEYTDNSDYGRVSDFRRGIMTYTLPVVVAATSSAETINDLHEIIDYDVITQTKGRLYYGAAYKEGWFYAASAEEYRKSDHMIKLELKFITDDSAWIKETEKTINGKAVVSSGTSGVNTLTDYPVDLSYDLVNNEKVIDVDIAAEAYVKLVINGAATAPKITIGSNIYEVDYTIKEGERIEIDGRKKTVKFYDINEGELNIFGSRNRDHDIFAKLTAGNNVIKSNGSYSFTVTLIEERSSAEWI